METTQAGVNVAKAVFEVALSDSPGTVRERHRLSRERFRLYFAAREDHRGADGGVRVVALLWPGAAGDGAPGPSLLKS